jgi:hypothetical protein
MSVLATRPRVLATMLVAGLVAGLIWLAWVPPRGQAWVIGHHTVMGMTVATLIPLEQENWIAADGRFACLMAILGIASGVLVWCVTPLRGALTVAVLFVGGVLSSALAGLVGFLLGGGHLTGETGHLITTRLMVHATGFYFLQPALCLLIYGLCAAFYPADDLSVDDEVVPTALVGAEG